MTITQDQRNQCADRLRAAAPRVSELTAFVGLDGFVDEILHVVDKREDATRYTRLGTIAEFAERLAAAAGRSTNVELVRQLQKLGGNGPIMANALASLGLQVTYLGNLGWPEPHPVFEEFTRRARVHTIAPPGLTDAYEFNDGKILVGKHESLKEVTWENIQNRWSREAFFEQFRSASLVGFVNWTMLPYMSEIWEALQAELCPKLNGDRRWLFVDLAAPEKRTKSDIQHALKLVSRFGKWFDVILGLNEKEAHEVGKALDLPLPDDRPEALQDLTRAIHRHVSVQTLVVHPVSYALAVSGGELAITSGPVTQKPLITTGAGDHFNSGFCLGKLLGLSDRDSLLTAVTTSGFYVRTARSPNVNELADTLSDPEIAY
jgi:sugar/nucleoside kinase (ribokinase family)